ncbi:unnamed protein product [Anisakis simplex]|uniref:Ras GTPase-activating protein-binding protein 1 n=1 Tax=Anisakis simplex TaxID=6269 RepID=A0A0M3K961_ANISI|nr:unnamed protein product [Anisakis simplex]
MKMEGVNELVNGRKIGREFVRQYYTMLSERPQDVFRFYSHESYFVHDIDQPVQGQQKIREAIERLEFVDCKARIYTVCGTATINNCLVVQVCGELSMNDQPGRRFLQTFILCPQTPKKYYVHNDVFQWLDRAFVDLVPTNTQQQQQNVSESVQNEVDERGNSGLTNGGVQPTVNGHQQVPADGSLHQSSTMSTASAQENVVERDEKKEMGGGGELNEQNEKLQEAQHELSSDKQQHDEQTQRGFETANEVNTTTHGDSANDNMTSTTNANVNVVAAQPNEQAQEQQAQRTVVTSAVDTGPKTWAKLVGGRSSSSSSSNQPQRQSSNIAAATASQTQQPQTTSNNSVIQQQQPSQNIQQSNVEFAWSVEESEVYGGGSNTSATTAAVAHTGNRFGASEDACRLYIGGISRNIIPDGPAVVEREIRMAFEKFGPVATVNVPRRVLDGPEAQRNVYAFVVMKTVEGAKNAFAACRKDRGMNFLSLRIDSFGFDGEATLSEQKGAQSSGTGQGGPRGMPYRGPPMQGWY